MPDNSNDEPKQPQLGTKFEQEFLNHIVKYALLEGQYRGYREESILEIHFDDLKG